MFHPKLYNVQGEKTLTVPLNAIWAIHNTFREDMDVMDEAAKNADASLCWS